MSFDTLICERLESYTKNPPRDESEWYGPWNTMLITLFPATEGYMVAPYRRLPDGCQDGRPDFIFEVLKMATTDPLTFRAVLVVKIRNSQDWESGIPALQHQLNLQVDTSFAGDAYSKMYWIGVIGPCWRYGEKKAEDEGKDLLQPLIDWHHTTHDQASFDDFQSLKCLIAAL